MTLPLKVSERLRKTSNRKRIMFKIIKKVDYGKTLGSRKGLECK